MRRNRSHPLSRRGLSSIKFVAGLPAILMMAWLGVEVGLGVRAMQQARTASDAIALAAAARARDGHEAARTDALAAAAASRGPNGPVVVTMDNRPGGGGDVERGMWDEATRTFTPDEEGGNAVRARVRFAADHPNGTVAPVLSGLFGASSMAVERTSIAVHVRARHTTSMLLMVPDGIALGVADSATIDADGGISARSTSDGCVVVGADASLVASVVRAAGSVDAASADQVDAAVRDGFSVPDDPFAGIDLPALNAAVAQAIAHDDLSVTQVAPGVHQGISIAGGSVVLLPGLHQFAGPVEVTGGSLVLQDATIHLDVSGNLWVGGAGSVTGTPGTVGDWAGAWIIQRGAASAWLVGDSSSVDVGGMMYAPDTELVVRNAAQLTSGSAILGSLASGGSSRITLEDDVDALKDVPVPGRARLVR